MTERAADANSYSVNTDFWVTIIREAYDRYRTELTNEAVLATLGDRTGLTVLDAGCGEGYLTRALAALGARVVGVDATAELVAAARAEAARQRLAVEYLTADVARLPPGFTANFDAVLLNHVVNDLKEPAGAFVEAARVLKPGGRLIALLLHPCFAHRNTTVDTYFSNKEISRPFEVAGRISPAPVTYWIRPLEDYVTLLVAAGFAITGLREPHPSEDQLRDSWWRENFTHPKFLLIEARKSS